MRGSWIVALVTTEGHVSWVRSASAEAVLTSAAGCASVAVDIPMGLPTSGYRASEQLARTRLGAARSSIFYTPVRVQPHSGPPRQLGVIGLLLATALDSAGLPPVAWHPARTQASSFHP